MLDENNIIITYKPRRHEMAAGLIGNIKILQHVFVTLFFFFTSISHSVLTSFPWMDVYIYRTCSVMETKIYSDKVIDSILFISFGRIEIHSTRDFNWKSPISGISLRCKVIFPSWRLQLFFFFSSSICMFTLHIKSRVNRWKVRLGLVRLG